MYTYKTHYHTLCVKMSKLAVLVNSGPWTRKLVQLIKHLGHRRSLIGITFSAGDNQVIHELPLALDLLQHLSVYSWVFWELLSDHFTENYSIAEDINFCCLGWWESGRISVWEGLRG